MSLSEIPVELVALGLGLFVAGGATGFLAGWLCGLKGEVRRLRRTVHTPSRFPFVCTIKRAHEPVPAPGYSTGHACRWCGDPVNAQGVEPARDRSAEITEQWRQSLRK